MAEFNMTAAEAIEMFLTGKETASVIDQACND
jgi:hypothetical protein